MTYLLHNIGQRVNSNYNTREEIANADGFLTFDGIYKNVYDNRDVLKGKKGILFVTGDYVGDDNTFDAPMPFELFADWNEIIEMVTEFDFELGWHTWSHPDLTTLSYEEILREVTPPFPMKYFAYPYGKLNQDAIKAVIQAGYEDAWSVHQGDDTQFQRKRVYLNW